MKPYQERVIEEYNALMTKIASLKSFVESEPLMDVSNVSPKERLRLKRQLLIMQLYQDVLSERICAFGESE